ncbi:MAG: DUF4340 domain-containing protein [Myxococcota bacterium]
MMRRRLLGMLVLLACGALAVAGVWWMERYDVAAEDERLAAAKLIAFRAASVRDVTLENGHGRFVMTREGSGWKLTEPMTAPADASIVDGLVAAVADVSSTRSVEIDGKPPVASELGMFGLDHPKVAVTVAGDDGTKTLELGKRNDFNGEVYARVRGTDAVAMVGAGIEFQVGKSLFDLRDKRLLVFEPADVERMDVLRGDRRLYAIVRENGSQRLLLDGGRSVGADALQLSGLTTALSTLRATRFIAEVADEAARKAAGFAANDVIRVRLTLSGNRSQVLALAHVAEPDGLERWAAMREGEPSPLAEISGDWLARKLDVDPKSLRDLRVVDFAREDVRGIVITRGGESVKLEAGEGGSWQLTAASPVPEGVALPREADASRCSGLLYRLFGLRAEQVLVEAAGDPELQAAGLAAPVLTVRLERADGNELATLLVATDSQGRATATQVGRGRIDLIGAGDASDISAKAADYLPAEAQATK